MASKNGVLTELSTAQLQIISDELNNSIYSALTVGGKVKQLNKKPLISNPTTAAPLIDRTADITVNDILTGAGITKADITLIKNDADSLQTWDLFFALNSVDINSPLATECVNSLSGILSADKVTAIEGLRKIPDPTWSAQIEGNSKLEDLLGSGWMIEGDDIKDL